MGPRAGDRQNNSCGIRAQAAPRSLAVCRRGRMPPRPTAKNSRAVLCHASQLVSSCPSCPKWKPCVAASPPSSAAGLSLSSVAEFAAKPIQFTPTGTRFDRRLMGRRVTAVDRLGKRVVVRLDDETSLVFEPRMTGLVLLADPPTREHLRLRIHLETAAELGKNLCTGTGEAWGWFAALRPGRAGKTVRAGPIGAGCAHDLRSRVLRENWPTAAAPIKVALWINGPWQVSAISTPRKYCTWPRSIPPIPATGLRAEQWQRLHHSMLSVLNAAIRYEGSTLSDGTYRNALNEQGGYQNHHRVYDRAGKSVPTCRRRNRVDRAGAALDVLLPRLSAQARRSP